MSSTGRQHEPSVAEALIEVRERMGLSRTEAARNSGVPKRYIEYFEGVSDDGISVDVYARHKLRTYSEFLNLDSQKVLDVFFHEKALPQKQPEVRHASRWRRHPLKNIPTRRLLVTPKIIRAALVMTVALGIGIFFVVRAQHMFAPPSIVLTSPQDGLVTAEKTLTVEGRTEREVTLLVNGKAVYIDSNGNFSDHLDMREGLNIVRVVAVRKHGQEAEVTRRVIVKPSERPTASLDIYGPAE